MYSNNNSNYYAFLPMLLACDDKYQKLSARACYLYSMMLSRMNLSEKNKHRFSDEKGVFIYFSLEEMCKYLNCSKPTAILAVQELLGAELVTREQAPNGKSPKYYVKSLGQNKGNSDYAQQNSGFGGKMFGREDVSFDVELAERQAREHRVRFGTMKNPKSRNRTSGSTL